MEIRLKSRLPGHSIFVMAFDNANESDKDFSIHRVIFSQTFS